jgi:GntR family transcriptional regulator
MVIQLNPRSSEPIYLQVIKQIKHLAAVGHLKHNVQLPTVRQLAADLHVNPNTVARAYTQLAREGIISTQQGRGTFVLEAPPPANASKLRREKLTTQVDALLKELHRLGYTPKEVETIWKQEFKNWKRLQS